MREWCLAQVLPASIVSRSPDGTHSSNPAHPSSTRSRLFSIWSGSAAAVTESWPSKKLVKKPSSD